MNRAFLTAILIIHLICSFAIVENESVKICSWNIRDFGKSKSDEELKFIAKTVEGFDIVVIQEVVAGGGGAQAVAKLVVILNRNGNSWDYSISNPTFGSSYKTERYCFLWQNAKVKRVGRPWLEQKYRLEIDREPFYCTFSKGKKEFTLVNFHAITKKMQPETEVKYFKFLPDQYPNLSLIFCGDFNLPQSHTVFNPLKKIGYVSSLQNQKTSLKKECKGEDCLASEFDNFFFHKQKAKLVKSGIIPFYKSFKSLKDANMISDHVPIFCELIIN